MANVELRNTDVQFSDFPWTEVRKVLILDKTTDMLLSVSKDLDIEDKASLVGTD